MENVTSVLLPDHGRAETAPPLSAAIYTARLAAAADRARQAGLEFLVVYGDREHASNLAYLTGFDPRFEESLLLIAVEGRKKLLVGNECLGYLPDPALGVEAELFQDFSLMGQSRARSRPLRQIMNEFGVAAKSRVGCVGWKYFSDTLLPAGALDLPAYLADLLRELTGDSRHVVNATAIFMDPQHGLRVVNEPEQIAQFEYAAGVTSAGVLALLRQIKPGVREQDLEKHLDACGLPLSCHRMISFGEKAKRGLASASANRANLGDSFTTAFGVYGALTCRAAVIAREPRDLPAPLRDFYPRFAANYFKVTAAWYEAVKVGAQARDVFLAAESARDPQLFDLAVNPGHYLHLDEWVHSPFVPNSDVVLRSGMVLQMDIIPISKGPFCYANAEDGIVLADESLQADLQRRFPELWQRTVHRRQFMQNVLGIQLDETVLPLSNTAGWLAPYALDLDRAFVKKLP